MLNLVQNFIIVSTLYFDVSHTNVDLALRQSLGLLVGSMIVALRVTKGTSAPSDFVFFITYLAQVGRVITVFVGRR
jgi:hypothetical protein